MGKSATLIQPQGGREYFRRQTLKLWWHNSHVLPRVCCLENDYCFLQPSQIFWQLLLNQWGIDSSSNPIVKCSRFKITGADSLARQNAVKSGFVKYKSWCMNRPVKCHYISLTLALYLAMSSTEQYLVADFIQLLYVKLSLNQQTVFSLTHYWVIFNCKYISLQVFSMLLQLAQSFLLGLLHSSLDSGFSYSSAEPFLQSLLQFFLSHHGSTS